MFRNWSLGAGLCLALFTVTPRAASAITCPTFLQLELAKKGPVIPPKKRLHFREENAGILEVETNGIKALVEEATIFAELEGKTVGSMTYHIFPRGKGIDANDVVIRSFTLSGPVDTMVRVGRALVEKLAASSEGNVPHVFVANSKTTFFQLLAKMGFKKQAEMVLVQGSALVFDPE